MSKLVDSQGRPTAPAGHNDTQYRQTLHEGGFGFFIHTPDQEQIVAACLIPNDGQVPDLPTGVPVWDYDPQMALMAFEVNAALVGVRADIAGARDACNENAETAVRELTKTVKALAARCAALEKKLEGDTP